MTFKSRYYAFGITPEGDKEFLHTLLDPEGAIAFLQKHRKLFGDRYPEYFYTTMNGEDNVEHYLK